MAHLDACEDCRTYFAELSALHDALDGMDEIEVPAGFADGVLARLHSEAAETPAGRTAVRDLRSVRRRRYFASFAAAAAVLALVVVPRVLSGGGAVPATGGTVMESRSLTAAAPPSASMAAVPAEMMADNAAAEETTEDALPEEMFETKTAYMTSLAEAPAAMERTLPETDYGSVNDAEEVTRSLTGEGAAEWLAEYGWQGESGDWYASASELRALPEGLALDEALPEDYEGTVRLITEEVAP